MTVELAGGGYRVRIDPEQGAAILSAEWTRPDGVAVPLLEQVENTGKPFKAGCFAMLPFANRVDHGRFAYGGQDIELPINLPDEDMAIHGFSRDFRWEIASEELDALVLAQDFERHENPYRYTARQQVRLSADGVRIDLSVRNEAATAMPFGMGLHPWFVKTPASTLSLESGGTFNRDALGLPTLPMRTIDAFDSECPTPLSSLPWFDGCFAGWQSRSARLVWPELGTVLSIKADGALRYLHVYVPDDRDVVCAEPVSHAPDAINRPELGAPMDILEPGEMLAGSMTIRAMPRPDNEVSR